MPSTLPAESPAERTRRGLLEAARALFSAQGYAATSMRQVADTAGLALGGIYNHFLSKEALFEAVLLEHPAGPPGPAADSWGRPGVQALSAELEQHPEFLNLILTELVEFNGRHLAQFLASASSEAGPAPAAARLRLGLLTAYHLTQTVLARLWPPDTFVQISPDAFMRACLNGRAEPE